MGAVFERDGFDVAPPPWPRMTFAEAIGRFGSTGPTRASGWSCKDLGDGRGRL